MGTLLIILDVVLLLAVMVHVPRAVLNGLQRDTGSLILSACIAAAAIVFGIVSFIAAAGLTGISSARNRIIFLAFLIVMPILIRVTWSTKTAH